MLEKGTIFTITEGCYDAYMIVGNYKALRDFSLEHIMVKFKSVNEGRLSRYRHTQVWRNEDFINYLITNEYVVHVKSKELHVGDYSLDDVHELREF